MKVDIKEIKAFQSKIRKFYRLYGRELPFRMINDSYAVTVSEIMLQQTQVDRVLPKYIEWIKKFPTWKKLSKASNKDILLSWSGLGYNRRALYLKNIAEIIINDYNGNMPTDIKKLQKLPGIGIYTSHAILIFAFQKRAAAVDTNIRKVLLSSFNFRPETSEQETQQLAEMVLPKTKIRQWHYGLMDYAKTLPQEIHTKYKSKYKQSKFDGSIRQIRGEIIRQLTKNNSITFKLISDKVNRSDDDIAQALSGLVSEKIIIVLEDKISLV